MEHGVNLPWHVARKQYEILDEAGRKVQAGPGGCYKFERFIFDALPSAKECAFVHGERETTFAPVKNAQGNDSPPTVRAAMQRLWAERLAEAGHDIRDERGEPDRLIEISPLFALSAHELRHKLPPGWQPPEQILLEP